MDACGIRPGRLAGGHTAAQVNSDSKPASHPTRALRYAPLPELKTSYTLEVSGGSTAVHNKTLCLAERCWKFEIQQLSARHNLLLQQVVALGRVVLCLDCARQQCVSALPPTPTLPLLPLKPLSWCVPQQLQLVRLSCVAHTPTTNPCSPYPPPSLAPSALSPPPAQLV